MAMAIPFALKGLGTAISGSAVRRVAKGSGQAQPIEKPAEPTIDDAAANRSEIDRIRRRRGVLSNIFGGASSSGSPSVAVKRLLGE
jgi:hypothetical protein